MTPGRRRPWEHVFSIDVDGHADEADVGAALAQMRTHTSMLRVLGSCPVAPERGAA